MLNNYTCEKMFVPETGSFPNSFLPVVHYIGILYLPVLFPGISVRALFKENGWYNSWSSGIFEFDHYHSNTFEVMGVIKGSAPIMLGGHEGRVLLLQKGDVLIIPPGVAHRNLGEEHQIGCIGAYPNGVRYNMRYGKAGERPKADHDIQRVPCPHRDPVFGTPYLQTMKMAEMDLVKHGISAHCAEH
jgi:uncharacterized protein YjlB